MKRGNYLIVLIISLLFIVSACKKGGQTTGAPSSPFIGGSSGLVINFEADSPPPEVTDSTDGITSTFPFKAIVRLTNEGEDDVNANEVKVDLIGFLPQDFGISDANKLINQKPTDTDKLRAKVRDADGKIIEGTTTFITIPAGNTAQDFLNAKRLAGNTEYTFRADVCYKYQTKAQARLCVLADLINIGQQEVCNPNQAKTVFSSSSPVQVTNFRESVSGKDKVSFSFDVVHSGNGDIYKDETVASAPTPICPRDDINNRRVKLDDIKVKVDISDLQGTDKLKCSLDSGGREGQIKLIGGKRTVTCNLDLAADRPKIDYEKAIDIILDFNYDSIKETRVLVKHLPTIT